MKYFIKLIKVVSWPIMFVIGQFFINYLFISFYNSQNIVKYRNIFPGFNDMEIINTIKYKTELDNFLNSNAFLITLITFIIFGLIFIRKYKKTNGKLKNKISIKTIFFIAITGIFISIFYNTLILNINDVIHITDNYYISSVPIYILILTTGLMGPILEELLFRGIIYNKLLTFNNYKKSSIITSIMFAIMHFPNFITMIYTFFLSFILIYLYDKYKTLKAPIIFHIAINTTITLLLPILMDNMLVNYLLFVFSIIILFIIIIKYEC